MSTVTDAQSHLLDFYVWRGMIVKFELAIGFEGRECTFASSASFESSDTLASAAAASSGDESSRSMTSDMKSFLGSKWCAHAMLIALSNSCHMSREVVYILANTATSNGHVATSNGTTFMTLSPSAAEVNTRSILFFVANLNFLRVI